MLRFCDSLVYSYDSSLSPILCKTSTEHLKRKFDLQHALLGFNNASCSKSSKLTQKQVFLVFKVDILYTWQVFVACFEHRHEGLEKQYSKFIATPRSYKKCCRNVILILCICGTILIYSCNIFDDDFERVFGWFHVCWKMELCNLI